MALPTLAPKAHGVRFRLLLVDEKTYISQLEKESYRSQGILVYQVENLRDAQSMLAQRSIDVICCNLDFGEGQGLEVYRALRASDTTNSYLWITASLTRDLQKNHVDLYETVDLCFVLPLSKEYFIEKVIAALDKKHRGDERCVVNQGYVRIKVDGTYVEVPLLDLSPSGMQVGAVPEVPQDYEGEMILFLDTLAPFQVQGRVVRTSEYNPLMTGSGQGRAKALGINFVSLEDAHQYIINNFLQTQKSQSRFANSYES